MSLFRYAGGFFVRCLAIFCVSTWLIAAVRGIHTHNGGELVQRALITMLLGIVVSAIATSVWFFSEHKKED